MSDGGDGGGVDPCECIFSHDYAMRRLISFLRNSQSYCTDTECFDELPGPQGTGSVNDANGLALMMATGLAIAFLLYLFRPAQLRNRGDGKPSRDRNDFGGPPPSSSAH